MVKLAQKHGMKGTKGDWKEFLNLQDKKLGACLSDPTRRSNHVLAAFLKTFTKEDDLKVLRRVFIWDIYFLYHLGFLSYKDNMNFMHFPVLSFLLK
jgi:hypothetical protein